LSRNWDAGATGGPNLGYLLPCIALLALTLAMASCGGGTDPTPMPTPTATRTPATTAAAILTPAATPSPLPQPTQMPTPVPPPTSTPMPAPLITRNDLPAMVLTQSDIASEFPDLRLNTQGGGYRDNEAAAATSLAPNDTASDLAAQGRLVGYEVAFSDLAAFSSGAKGRPIGATASVVFFDSPDSAQASLRRDFSQIDRFLGREAEGITLKAFQRVDAPDVGSNAVAGRLTVTVAALNLDTTSSFVAWQRGPIVASVGASALDDEDRSSAMDQLARRMDGRIKGVLAGEISVAPLPTPTATPSPSPTRSVGTLEEAARREGFDLAAMLPALDDLPADAAVTVEGFLDQPGAIAAYKREFGSSGPFMALGSSQVINIGSTVELHRSTLDARTRVTILETFGPEVFGQLVAAVVAGTPGLTAPNIATEAFDLPPIGDLRAGFLVEIETPAGGVQGHMVFYSQGRLFGQLVVIGPAVALEDTVALARLMEAGMRTNSPQ